MRRHATAYEASANTAKNVAFENLFSSPPVRGPGAGAGAGVIGYNLRPRPLVAAAETTNKAKQSAKARQGDFMLQQRTICNKRSVASRGLAGSPSRSPQVGAAKAHVFQRNSVLACEASKLF